MIPYEFDAERFSRWMAYVLRHNPSRYGLQPDRHGYVDLEAFIEIARRRYPHTTAEVLRDLIETSGSGRFEIVEGRLLRARYGHSIPVEPPTAPIQPPARLYHGIEAARLEVVLSEGLKPIDRQMLHLSETLEEAVAIIRRKTDQPAMVCVQAAEAYRDGVPFFREGKVYLTIRIPAAFVRRETLPAPTMTSGGSGPASPEAEGSSPTASLD